MTNLPKSDLRLQRTIRLLLLILNGQGSSTNRLSSLLECSRRTVFRDLRTLKECGVDIQFDNALGGYTVKSGVGLLLPAGDDAALCNLLGAALTSPWLNHSKIRRSLILSAERTLPFLSRDARDTLSVLLGGLKQQDEELTGRDDLQHLVDLANNIRQGNALRIELHYPNGNPASQVDVWARQLTCRNNQWILIAESFDPPVELRIDAAHIARFSPIEPHALGGTVAANALVHTPVTSDDSVTT